MTIARLSRWLRSAFWVVLGFTSPVWLFLIWATYDRVCPFKTPADTPQLAFAELRDHLLKNHEADLQRIGVRLPDFFEKTEFEDPERRIWFSNPQKWPPYFVRTVEYPLGGGSDTMSVTIYQNAEGKLSTVSGQVTECGRIFGLRFEGSDGKGFWGPR